MKRSHFAAMTASLFVSAALLTGCGNSAAVQAGINTTISTAQADVQKAITLYGIVKGIAQVATLADPTIGPLVSMATTTLDPLVAKAQTALNDATIDANALEALAATITAQANTLTTKTAGVVTVVPTVTLVSAPVVAK